jgi:putative membrane protein
MGLCRQPPIRPVVAPTLRLRYGFVSPSEPMFLSDAEASAIDAQIGRLESRTGVQVATAVIGKSDTYVELPWKAFALGAALAAFAVVLADFWRPQWVTSHTALIHAVTMLGTGAASALLAVFVPPFARLFLRATRRHLEVRQYARSLFLTRELFRTRGRTGVLILVSLFERTIEVVPDTGLHGRVCEGDWELVIARMTPRLRESRPFDALQEGLAALEGLLTSKGFQPGTGSNDLPDRPIEERGA